MIYIYYKQHLLAVPVNEVYFSWNSTVTYVVITPKVAHKNGKFNTKSPQILNSTFMSFI